MSMMIDIADGIDRQRRGSMRIGSAMPMKRVGVIDIGIGMGMATTMATGMGIDFGTGKGMARG